MGTDRGSVRWHRGGWEIRYQVAGRRHTKRIAAPNTRAGRRTAEAALDALVARHDLNPDGLTLAQLLDRYETARSAAWSPATLKQMPSIRAALLEYLGDVPVDQLRPEHVDAAYTAMAVAGAKPGTIRRRHAVLRAALGLAVRRWHLIARNPAEGAEIPTGTPMRAGQDLPALADVLEAITGLDDHPRLRTAAGLAVATGARRGELAALRWADVDLDAGVVIFAGSIAVGPAGLVRKGTKTGKPKTLSIDPGTVAELKRWRATCRRAALELGQRHNDTDPVLPSPSDPRQPWHPERITRAWLRARDGIGLGGVRWHDLRHLHATSLLAAGISPADGAARLGHASTRTFLDIYAHAVPAGDREAADVIARARAGA